MKEVILKVKHHFDAAHKLNDYKGACANLHGHRWNIEVFAKGIIKPNGMLIDFTKIKKEIDKLDHAYLNDVLEFNPTAEHIVTYLLAQFEVEFPEIDFKIILYESPETSIMVKSDNY